MIAAFTVIFRTLQYCDPVVVPSLQRGENSNSGHQDRNNLASAVKQKAFQGSIVTKLHTYAVAIILRGVCGLQAIPIVRTCIIPLFTRLHNILCIVEPSMKKNIGK